MFVSQSINQPINPQTQSANDGENYYSIAEERGF